jgi:hypothetical protein
MPGKTAKEAIEVFAGFLNETLSCLTDRRLLAHQGANNTFILLYQEPVRLLSLSGIPFYLNVTQVCNAERRDDGTFKAHTREYSYVFSDSAVASKYGILAYHWHPDIFALRYPHLHIKITPLVGSPEIERKISRAHFPTSRVSLEDFVYLLLKYYDIRSPHHHSRYRSILNKNRGEFSKGATWTVQPRN